MQGSYLTFQSARVWSENNDLLNFYMNLIGFYMC
jgi:hypothetical protein